MPSKNRQRQYVKLAAGILISIGLLWWAGRGLDFASMFTQLKNAQYGWILPLLIVRFFTFWARSWRWAYLLRPIKPLSSLRLFPPIAIGYMANNLLPFRLGELLRGYVLRQQEGIPVSTGLVTVGVERIFDGVTVLLLVFVTLPFAPFPAEYRPFLWLGTLGFLGGLLFLLGLANNVSFVSNLVAKFVPKQWQDRVVQFVGRLQAGLSGLQSKRQFALIAATSILVWLLETGKFFFVAKAFSLDVPFTFLLLMVGVVNLVSALPATPGFVGTFDAPIVAMLTLAGITTETAWAYTLVLHALLWLTSVGVGGFFAIRMGLKWGEWRVEIGD